MQTCNNSLYKYVWKGGVTRADQGSRKKVSKSGVNGNAGFQPPKFPVADATSRPYCSLWDLWCPFQVMFDIGVLVCS